MIPTHLLLSISKAILDRKVDSSVLTSNVKLSAFLMRLTKFPHEGITFGMSANEISQLCNIWEKVTNNGQFSSADNILKLQNKKSLDIKKSEAASILELNNESNPVLMNDWKSKLQKTKKNLNSQYQPDLINDSNFLQNIWKLKHIKVKKN